MIGWVLVPPPGVLPPAGEFNCRELVRFARGVVGLAENTLPPPACGCGEAGVIELADEDEIELGVLFILEVLSSGASTQGVGFPIRSQSKPSLTISAFMKTTTLRLPPWKRFKKLQQTQKLTHKIRSELKVNLIDESAKIVTFNAEKTFTAVFRTDVFIGVLKKGMNGIDSDETFPPENADY